MNNLIPIKVAFASINLQKVISLEVLPSISVVDAIIQSKIQDHFPEFDILSLSVGIYGKTIDPKTYKLQANDRIEIYRSLTKTPNQNRLLRAK